jgi:hypothetical protein
MAKLDLKIFPYASEGNKRRNVVDEGNISKADKLVYHFDVLLGLLPSTLLSKKDLYLPEYNYSLFPSVTGKIEQIVFHFPKVSNFKTPSKEAGLHHLIIDLASKMKNTKFYVLTNEEGSKTPVEFFLETKENVKTLKVIPERYQKHSYWAKDSYLAAFDSDGKLYLIEPESLIQRANSDDSGVLTKEVVRKSFSNVNYKRLRYLDFDGGNILVGNSFVLMGIDTLTYNSTYSDSDINQAGQTIWYSTNNKNLNDKQILIDKLRRYTNENKPNLEKTTLLLDNNDKAEEVNYKTFFKYLKAASRNKEKLITTLFNRFVDAKPIHFIGKSTPISENKDYQGCIHESALSIKSRNQPFFHLDFFITLLGPVHDKYQILVGDPVIGLSNEKLAALDSETLGIISTQIYRMKHSVDEVIEQLKKIEQLDFVINRIPLPLTYHNTLTKENKIEFKWYWASYNNCLVEIDGRSKKVWLPSYVDNYSNEEKLPNNSPLPSFPEDWKSAWRNYDSEKKIDYGNWSDLEPHQKKANEVWNNLGYTVTPVNGDLHQYLQKNGSICCLTNCIKRNIKK